MTNLEVKKIILEGKGRIEIFHFQPESIDNEKRGSLFFIGAMYSFDHNDPSYYLLNSLAATLKRAYYSPTLNHHAQAFEASLKKANTFLIAIPKEIKASLELAVLVLRKNQVSFSFIGNPEILLIREGKLFRLITSTPSQRLFFKNIGKGKVKNQDRIIVSTSKIKPLLEHSTFVSRLIKRSFDRLEDYLKKERAIVSKDSEKGLALLYIGVGNIPEYYVLKQAPSFDEYVSEEKGEQERESQKAYQKRSFQLTLSLGISKTLFPPGIGSLPLLSLLKRLKNWLIPNAFTKTRQTLNKLTLLGSAFFQTRKKLTLPSSLKPQTGLKLIGIGILFIAVALLGIIFFQKKHISLTRQDQVQTLFIAPLPRLEMIMTFDNLLKGSNLSDLPSKNTQKFQGGILTKKKAFLFSQGAILEADLHTKNIEPILNLPSPLALSLDEADTPLFVTKEEEKLYFYRYDPDQRSLSKEVMVWPLKSMFIKGVEAYARNIYVLEGIEKQVVKYKANDFLLPSFWIEKRSQKELSTPLDLAIDGSIYILDSPNKVIEFRLGEKKQEFTLPQPVSAETKLKTKAHLQSLYLYDPMQNLLIAMDKKTGRVAKERTFPTLQKILDIFPDEENQEFLILTIQGIFRGKF